MTVHRARVIQDTALRFLLHFAGRSNSNYTPQSAAFNGFDRSPLVLRNLSETGYLLWGHRACDVTAVRSMQLRWLGVGIGLAAPEPDCRCSRTKRCDVKQSRNPLIVRQDEQAENCTVLADVREIGEREIGEFSGGACQTVPPFANFVANHFGIATLDSPKICYSFSSPFMVCVNKAEVVSTCWHITTGAGASMCDMCLRMLRRVSVNERSLRAEAVVGGDSA